MGLAEWQELIVERLHNGGSLSDVEAEIIDRSPRREQKAALWLYAHGLLSGARVDQSEEW